MCNSQIPKAVILERRFPFSRHHHFGYKTISRGNIFVLYHNYLGYSDQPSSSHPKWVVKNKGDPPPKWPKHSFLRMYNKLPRTMVPSRQLDIQQRHPTGTRFLFNAAVMGFSSSRAHRGTNVGRFQPVEFPKGPKKSPLIGIRGVK